MSRPQVEKEGWYRVTVRWGKGHRTFIGQCTGIAPPHFPRGYTVYTFEIGFEETATTWGPDTLQVAEGNIISLRWIHPMRLRTRATKKGAKTVERYEMIGSSLSTKSYRLLKERLLGIGGNTVSRQTSQLPCRTLYQRGRWFRSYKWEHTHQKWTLPNECHGNAASIWEKTGHAAGWKVVTGYGLGIDGLWEPHSWLIDQKNRIIKETTVSRKAYFGVILTTEEAERWFQLVKKHKRRFKDLLKGVPDKKEG